MRHSVDNVVLRADLRVMVTLKIRLPDANKRWNLADQALPSLSSQL